MASNANKDDQLMSTMGNIMSTREKDERNDANDSTPTSSTDAHMSTSVQFHVTDDPISSTSSDVVGTSGNIEENSTKNPSKKIIDNTMSTLISTELLKASTTTSIVPEKDLLDINITDIPTEKITENVDDIVQDLENLLGEPTTSYISQKSKDIKDVKRKENIGFLDKIISSNLIETENLELPVLEEFEKIIKDDGSESKTATSILPQEKKEEIEKIEELKILKEKPEEVTVEKKNERLVIEEAEEIVKDKQKVEFALEKQKEIESKQEENLVEEKQEVVVEKRKEVTIEEKPEEVVVEKQCDVVREEKQMEVIEERPEVVVVEEKQERIKAETNQEEIADVVTDVVMEEEVVGEKPNAVIIEEKPEEVIVEEKPEEVIIEEKPDEVIIEEKPEEVIVEEKPYIIIEDKSEEVIIEEKPEEVIVKVKPHEIVVEEKPNEVVIEEKPDEVVEEKPEEIIVEEKQEGIKEQKIEIVIEEKEKESEIVQEEPMEVIVEEKEEPTAIVEKIEEKLKETDTQEKIKEATLENLIPVVNTETLSSERTEKINVAVIEKDFTDNSNNVILQDNLSDNITIKSQEIETSSNIKNDSETVQKDISESSEIKAQECAHDLVFAENIREENKNEEQVELIAVEKMEVGEDSVPESNQIVEAMEVDEESVLEENVPKDDRKEEKVTATINLIEEDKGEKLLAKEEKQAILIEKEEVKIDVTSEHKVSDELPETKPVNSNENTNVFKENINEGISNIAEEKPSEKPLAKITESNQDLISTIEPEMMDTTDDCSEIAKIIPSISEENVVKLDLEPVKTDNNLIEKHISESTLEVSTSSATPKKSIVQGKEITNQKPEVVEEILEPLVKETDAVIVIEGEPRELSNIEEDKELSREKKDKLLLQDEKESKEISQIEEEKEFYKLDEEKESPKIEENTELSKLEEKEELSKLEDKYELPKMEEEEHLSKVEKPKELLNDEEKQKLLKVDQKSELSKIEDEEIISDKGDIGGSIIQKKVSEIKDVKLKDIPVDSEICSSTSGNQPEELIPPDEEEIIQKPIEKLEAGLVMKESIELVDEKIDENNKLGIVGTSNVEAEKEDLISEFISSEENKKLLSEAVRDVSEELVYEKEEELVQICQTNETIQINEEKMYEEPIDHTVSNEIIEESNINEDVVNVLIQAAEESRQRGNTFEITTSPIIETEDIAKNMEEQSNELKNNKDIKEPLVIDIGDLAEKEKSYSPKLLIKPIKEPEDQLIVSTTSVETESTRGSLKMTITKQSNTMHSILKIYNPEDEELPQSSSSLQILDESNKPRNSPDSLEQSIEQTVPKLIIKSLQSNEQHSPKISARNSRQVCSPTTIVTNHRTNSPKITIKPIVKPEVSTPSSPIKLTIKPIVKTDEGQKQRQSPKLILKSVIITDEEVETNKVHSPRITIKPIVKSAEEQEQEQLQQQQSSSPKITIKPIVKSAEEEAQERLLQQQQKQTSSPRITIKPIVKSAEEQRQEQEQQQISSPRITIKPIVKSAEEQAQDQFQQQQQTSSPRITIKPVVKSAEEEAQEQLQLQQQQQTSSPRITIKPIVKSAEDQEQEQLQQQQSSSPRITIKPVVKSTEEEAQEQLQLQQQMSSPRITIKPIVKSVEEQEQEQQIQEQPQQIISPRITIKPIVKPVNEGNVENIGSTPKLTIKPIVRPSETEQTSPKITIKPVVKPPMTTPTATTVASTAATIDPGLQLIDFEDEIKQRIVLKINKGNLSQSSIKELRKKDYIIEDDKLEKLAKIKLKFSKEDGHPHIVHQNKRTIDHLSSPSSSSDYDKSKKLKFDNENLGGLTITPIHTNLQQHSKLKERLTIATNKESSSSSSSNDNKINIVVRDESTSSDDVKIVENVINKIPASPIIISEDSAQDDSLNDKKDPLAAIPVFEISINQTKVTTNDNPTFISDAPPIPPAPRKRGRPRKVPLQVREDFKDPKEEEPKVVLPESTRPKRSCRGPSVRTTLGIKPRKPRGPGRGRGSKRGMGTRVIPMKPAKEPKLSAAKLKLMKESFLSTNDKISGLHQNYEDGFLKIPPTILGQRSETYGDIVMYEEETRMSAETNSSRAQTPAKQVISSATGVDIEESQSSVQSTATTESAKVRGRGTRLEVHQEPEGAVISADQLAEYYWSGGGPYMLQEQVAQFLGIKSFKRKYPHISRRFVDMQERDFIRESGLACEAMCDLGLTAVNSADILDIMYSDFQDKYEEYCKHQRDRQAKDLTNKQKALSLAASQEKNKIDITQQAVNSAATWNATFNKTRREQRKAFMDLQTLTVHFPKGKVKTIEKPKIGDYPLALVPGQFTDYYEEFTPTEINNLPLNTMCYDPIHVIGLPEEMDCDSQSDGSASDSDSSSSDSDSSNSGSSDVENCTLCKPTTPGKRVIVT